MRARLLSPRECVFWTAAFVLVAALIVATHFSSTDPDSQLYASISGRLSEEPVSHWIAPEWWDFWPAALTSCTWRSMPPRSARSRSWDALADSHLKATSI